MLYRYSKAAEEFGSGLNIMIQLNVKICLCPKMVAYFSHQPPGPSNCG